MATSYWSFPRSILICKLQTVIVVAELFFTSAYWNEVLQAAWCRWKLPLSLTVHIDGLHEGIHIAVQVYSRLWLAHTFRNHVERTFTRPQYLPKPLRYLHHRHMKDLEVALFFEIAGKQPSIQSSYKRLMYRYKVEVFSLLNMSWPWCKDNSIFEVTCGPNSQTPLLRLKGWPVNPCTVVQIQRWDYADTQWPPGARWRKGFVIFSIWLYLTSQTIWRHHAVHDASVN